jgi:hypothetical protein
MTAAKACNLKSEILVAEGSFIKKSQLLERKAKFYTLPRL